MVCRRKRDVAKGTIICILKNVWICSVDLHAFSLNIAIVTESMVCYSNKMPLEQFKKHMPTNINGPSLYNWYLFKFRYFWYSNVATEFIWSTNHTLTRIMIVNSAFQQCLQNVCIGRHFSVVSAVLSYDDIEVTLYEKFLFWADVLLQMVMTLKCINVKLKWRW